MNTIFKLLLGALFLCYSTVSAVTRTVTIPNGNNPWAPTAGSLAEAMSLSAVGDSIIFDFALLGNSPTITLDNAFKNAPQGGFILDGLRGLPVASDLVKIQISGSVGVNNGALLIGTGNTTLIGLDFVATDGNGIFITSSNNTIDSCHVHDNNYHGINISNAGSNNTIKNSLIYNNNAAALGSTDHENAGIYTMGSTTIIDSCYIYGNGANGVLIRNANAANSEVKNCVIGRDAAGVESGNNWNGIFVWIAGGALIENNVVVNNGQTPNGDASRVSGIRLQEVTSGTIQQNYVGTDAAKADAGNAFDGITLHTNVSGISIAGNIVCNNGFLSAYGAGGGIAFRNSVATTTLTGNFIGAHADLTNGGNNDYGISIEGCNGIVIGGNNPLDGNTIGYSKRAPVIGSSRGCGLWLVLPGATNNQVFNNSFISNSGPGIELERSAANNIIGDLNKGNSFVANQYGILIHTAAAIKNTLRYNSFSCNTVKGISLQNGGNNEYGNATPIKDIVVNTSEIRANFISGYAPSANATVDVYLADNICPVDCDNSVNQGMTMVATVTAAGTASNNGLFFWEYDFVTGGNLVNKNTAVVLATESGAAGAANTSEFSVCANLCNTPLNSSISSADLNLCPGESTVLTALSTGKAVGEGYSYNWYTPSISPGNKVHYAIDDSVLTVSAAGTYLVVISSQLDSVSCSDTTTNAVVFVNTKPVIDLTATATSICTGDSVILDAGTTEPNLTYLWKPNSEVVDTIVVKSQGTYEVVVTNSVSGCKDSADVSISESPVPVLSLSAPFFCQGDSTLVDAGISNMTYTWSPSGKTTQSFYVTSAGTHNVVVTDPLTSCSASGSILADQSPDPKPSVELPADSSMCLLQGDQIEISATVTTSSVGLLTWSDGTTVDTEIMAVDTIYYWASYADSYGCTGADTMKIKNECTPPDPTLPNIITVNSPWTPFGDITPDQVIASDFVVYNRWGVVMFTSDQSLPVWDGKKESGAECSYGVYFWIWKYTDVTGESYNYNGFLQLITE